jgi:hypothetical protein
MPWAVRALPGNRGRDSDVLVTTSRPLRSACVRRVLLCGVVLALCGACGASGEAKESTRSVCSDCPGLAGGESSDFGGGTPHPCLAFEQRVPISDARAIELGFDMARLTALIERDFDAPLRWMASEPNRGGPAAGYEARTRIEGRARRGDWLTYVGLDPSRCQDTVCNDDDVGEWTCADSLELGVEVELRTVDGAVSATASGYVLQGRPGFPFERPAGSQRADLRDVTGSLRLFPPASPPIRYALLMIDLLFEADQIEGDLRPYFYLSAREGSGEDNIPLAGHWPDVPMLPDEPAQGGPEPL